MNAKTKFKTALINFNKAAKELTEAWGNYDPALEMASYPFKESFDTTVNEISEWVADNLEAIDETN